MRTAFALLALFLLAGCSGKAGDDPPVAATSTAGPTASNGPMPDASDPEAEPPVAPAPAPTLRLVNCNNYGGVFPVPMDSARAALPPGFEPIATPSDPAGGATLYVLYLQCLDSAVDGRSTGTVELAYAELAVVPPADLALKGIEDYTVPLAFGADVEAVAERLALYGLGVTGLGDAEGTITSDVNGLRVRHLSMSFAGISLAIDLGAPPVLTGLGDGGFALIGVQDGAVRTVVQASSQGGQAAQGAAAMQSDGLALLEEARPATRGFTVEGFTLDFALARTFA